MADPENPFADIGDRLRWHRESIEAMTQRDYAEALGMKRPRYSLWESGIQRLSIDGALALKSRYGLSLDFLYLGDAAALDMTLRQAWRDRFLVRGSK